MPESIKSPFTSNESELSLVVVSPCMMDIIRTSRGGDKLILNDYMYISKVTKDGKRWWVCTKSKSLNCKGAVTTDDPSGNPRVFKPHNHLSNAAEVEVARFRAQTKSAARSNIGVKTHNILSTGLQGLSNEGLLLLPQTNSIKRDIQRHKAAMRPAEPANLQSIVLVNPWTTTGGVNPAPFLIHDSGPLAGADRVIVFAEDGALQHLASTNVWYVDGNFKSSPLIFDQVYVIRARLDAGAVSCVYGLLPGKEGRHYTEMFSSV